jgi:hypothetical protein
MLLDAGGCQLGAELLDIGGDMDRRHLGERKSSLFDPAREKALRRDWSEAEAVWERAERALNLFRPDGTLNGRTWAEAEIAAALPDWEGARWAKARRMLTDPRALTFLDRLHRDLTAAAPRAELRAALAGLWRLRQASRPGCGPAPVGSCGVLAPVVQALVCAQRAADWHGPTGGSRRYCAGWCGPAAWRSALIGWCGCTRRGTGR